MKFLIAPDFARKAQSLSSDASSALTTIIAFIKASPNIDKLASGNSVQVSALGREILSLKSGDIRVYATPTTIDHDEHLLLLDFAQETADPITLRRAQQTKRHFASKDPRTNSHYNPNMNPAIDPRRNMAIDPRRNMTIDPRRNMTIDPRRNMTIDPRRNMMIDPRRNSYYGGPYVYSLNMEQVGFVVRANDQVSLIFNMSAEFIEYFVSAHNGANIFDLSAQWTGFLVNTNTELLLRFDTQASWVGFIV